jgi:hypothetical protein
MAIDKYDDLIDIRDVIARVEEIEEFKESEGLINEEAAEELIALQALLEECKGNGGDEQWRGDWYPISLIRDSYFKDYAQELAEEIGAINANASWPNNCIDWDQAARELQIDYTSIDFDGVTYWVR